MVHKSQKPLVQVNLRLRDDLRRKLAGEAKKSGRSFNQELVFRLEHSLEAITAEERYHAANELLDQARTMLQKVAESNAKATRELEEARTLNAQTSAQIRRGV